MELHELLACLEEHQAVIIQEAGGVKVRAPKPLPADFTAELRAHKPELLAYLERRRRAEEAAADIEKSGWGVYWCDLFGEAVAFVWDERFRAKVPAGIVVYTRAEIETLWAAEGPSDAQLRLIHQAKKQAGARVTDFTKGGDNADSSLS